MIDLPPPELWYPYLEFLEDFRASTQGVPGGIVEYLQRRYPDKDLFVFRIPRLTAAVKYLKQHQDEINRGSLAVFGEEAGMVTGRVIVALWLHWARPETDPATYDPPIEEFVRTCETLPGDNYCKTEDPSPSD